MLCIWTWTFNHIKVFHLKKYTWWMSYILDWVIFDAISQLKMEVWLYIYVVNSTLFSILCVWVKLNITMVKNNLQTNFHWGNLVCQQVTFKLWNHCAILYKNYSWWCITWLCYETQIYCVMKCKIMHHRKWWLSLTTQKRQGGSTTMCSLCYVLGHHRRIGLHRWSSKPELSSTVWSTLSHHLYWMASH